MIRALVEWQRLKPACMHAWTDIYDMSTDISVAEGMVQNRHLTSRTMGIHQACIVLVK